MYVVWVIELQEYSIFVGIASTKKKAEQLREKAYNCLKNKNSVPDDFDLTYFEIEKLRDGQLHSSITEYD